MQNTKSITKIFVVALCYFWINNHLKAEQPNVLFIAVDDLNDWIGCMEGHPQALTPNMDKLAKRGILFTNAHCVATACNPSRAAVFSGRTPQATGVWANGKGQSIDNTSFRLLPKAFIDGGYDCVGTGKLFHGSGGGKKHFQEYYSVNQRWSPFPKNKVQYTAEELPSKGTLNPRHVFKDSRGRTVILPLNRMPSDRNPNKKDGESFDWGPFDVADSEFGDKQITDWAISKLKEETEKPLFLAVGYYRPHIPLWAPKRFFDRFKSEPAKLPLIKKDDLDDLSDSGRNWAKEAVTAGSHKTVVEHKQWRSAVEAYLACVTYVDHEIGRLLKTLDESSVSENTWVILWSDHGWHLGEKEHWGKWTGWERSTKVPLMIIPPKTNKSIPRNARCHQPVSLLDLYPTLVEICKLTPPSKLDGQSLVPLLTEPGKSTGRAVVTMFDEGNYSIRTESLRYIRYADGSEELYDHKSDSREWNNVASHTRYVDHLEHFRRLINRETR